jgi:hypothetical protein
MHAKRCLALALAFAAGACTPMQWVRDDGGPAQAGADLAECRRDAWLRAYDWSVHYGALPPFVMRDAQGRVTIVQPHGPFLDPFMLEAQRADFCMRQRGYRLEPLKPPS